MNMNRIFCIVILAFTSFSLAYEPNDFVDPNGGLDVEALMEYLNDPNRESAEIVQPVQPEPINIPFISQWLEKATMHEKTYSFQEVSENVIPISGSRIEWVFEDGKWMPTQTGGTAAIALKETRRLESVVLSVNGTDVELSGDFQIKIKVPINPSCDKNGDGIVNLYEFAIFAKEWKK